MTARPGYVWDGTEWVLLGGAAHLHDDYAGLSHSHAGYAPTSHSHAEYMTQEEFNADSASVSARFYGAVGDGVTNDTAALQLAIDETSANGRWLYIPAGTYKLTASLVVNGGVKIVADGTDTRLIQYGAGVPVMYLGGANNVIRSIQLEQDVMPTSSGDAFKRGENGIEIDDLYFSKFEDIHITKVAYGILLSDASSNFMFSCQWDTLNFSFLYSGAIRLWHDANSGSTGNVFNNVYCNGNVGSSSRVVSDTTDYPIRIQGLQESVFNQLNIEAFNGTSMLIQQSGVTFNALHLEWNELTDGATLIRLYFRCGVVINGLTIERCDMGFDATGSTSVISIGGGTIKLVVNVIRMLSMVNTNAGPWYIYREDSDQTATSGNEVHIVAVNVTGAVVPSANIHPTYRFGLARYGPDVLPHMARIYPPYLAQALTQYAQTAITLTTIAAGALGWHVGTATPSALVASKTGLYQVDAAVRLNSTTAGKRDLSIAVNGTNKGNLQGALETGTVRLGGSKVLSLVAGDAVTMRVYSESTTGTVELSGENDTYLQMTYLGAVI